MVAFPPIVPGWTGVLFTVTVNDCTSDEPQLLLAVTVTSPLVAFGVAPIELVVEVPVQPFGKVQA